MIGCGLYVAPVSERKYTELLSGETIWKPLKNREEIWKKV
jgi:hypothetical protein